jgi:two-component system chemotaxis sensor kinase CheA
MNEFIEQFLIECRELVEQATEDLLALEQHPDNRERLDSAFRAFHTLKGAAGIVEFSAMGRLLHAAEDVLSSVRAGDHPVTVDLISHCLTSLDQVVQWLDAMEVAGDPPQDADAAADRLIARFTADTLEVSGPAEPEGLPAWVAPLVGAYPDVRGARAALRYAPDAACFFRGEDPLALVARIPGLLALRLAPAAPWPSLEDFDPFACNLIVEALWSGEAEGLAEALRTVSDQVQIHALPRPGNAGGLSDAARAILQAQVDLVRQSSGEGFEGRLASAARVAANVLRHAGRAGDGDISEALARSLDDGDPSPLAQVLAALLADPAEAADDGEDLADPAGPGVQEATARALRVDVERIDAIIKLTGELTVVKNAVGHAARLARDGGDARALAQALKEQHAQLERLTAELQRSVVAIRVLPLRHVFQRFSRLVREMTASLGKSARLVIEVETTEADKAVVEALFEPLLHVVRNALDHGVETPAARVAAGKSEAALIRLSGFREGERVIVEVADDGHGIDPAVIRRVAAEHGVMTAEALGAVSDDDVLELIFAPGFSTAAAVTDLSGRGVGMDAVRSTVERLGGRVSVRSRLGEGTTVRFILPFTVMMTRVMIVEAAGQVFGVPFEAIVETLQIPKQDISAIGAAEAFVLRSRTVPLVSLARTLGLPGAPDRPPLIKAVITAVGGQMSALEVDGFGERLDVMLKPMDGLLAGVDGVAGTTLLGDGRVLIVLDLQELLL